MFCKSVPDLHAEEEAGRVGHGTVQGDGVAGAGLEWAIGRPVDAVRRGIDLVGRAGLAGQVSRLTIILRE